MEKKEPLSISLIFLRFITGFGAGFAGSVVLGIVIMLSWSIVGDTIAPTEKPETEFGLALEKPDTHPLFLSLVTLAVFLATLTGSMCFVLLSTIVEEKYTYRSTILTQVFFANLLLLFCVLPLYLIGNGLFGPSGIAAAGILHSVVIGLFSLSALEILNVRRYLFVNVYGVIIGFLVFSIFVAILLKFNSTILAFLALPFLYGFISGGNGLAEVFYNWLYRTYGTDFLNTDSKYTEEYVDNSLDKDPDFDI